MADRIIGPPHSAVPAAMIVSGTVPDDGEDAGIGAGVRGRRSVAGGRLAQCILVTACPQSSETAGCTTGGVSLLDTFLPRETFLLGYEAVVFLLACESNDGPCRPSTGPAHALDPVVPVLKDELSIAVSHDNWRWFPPFPRQLVHVFDPIVPVVVVNRTQHRIPRWPGQAMQLIEGHLNGASPPPQFLGQLLGQYGIITAGTRKESTHPLG